MTGVITDPVGDLLTRVRNALHARHADLQLPHSGIKLKIAEILVREGYVDDVEVVPGGPQPALRIKLKYTTDRRATILGLKRISKPGLRVFVGRKQIPSVQGGLGIAILSTSKGVMTDREARRANVGGELLCEVW